MLAPLNDKSTRSRKTQEVATLKPNDIHGAPADEVVVGWVEVAPVGRTGWLCGDAVAVTVELSFELDG